MEVRIPLDAVRKFDGIKGKVIRCVITIRKIFLNLSLKGNLFDNPATPLSNPDIQLDFTKLDKEYDR